MAQQRSRASKAYEAVLSTSAGREMFDDLVVFAQQEKDPLQALGISKVLLRMWREKNRIKSENEETNE